MDKLEKKKTNKKDGKIGFWYSWPVIILTLILFWPVGLYLIIKRFSSNKADVVKNSSGKGLKITGVVLIVFGGLGIMGSFDPFSLGGLVSFIFFIAGGFALLNKAKKIRSQGECIKEYLSIIVNGNVYELDAIASTTGKSYDVVHKDIKSMIDKGFLKNAYIDEGTREVVLPGSRPVSQSNANTVSEKATSIQFKTIACPCCGANNTIQGDIGECEYCGSPLK